MGLRRREWVRGWWGGSRSEVLGLLARRNVAPLRRLGGCCAAGRGPARRAAGAGEGRGW